MFIEYERFDVDCVLFSTHGTPTPGTDGRFSLEVQGHAASKGYWVSYATTRQDAVNGPSGIIAPGGEWASRCSADADGELAVADLVIARDGPQRPWRRSVRSGIHAAHLVDGDSRSTLRTGF